MAFTLRTVSIALSGAFLQKESAHPILMLMKLTNRTILITGGTSGIGLELARQLLTRDNTVLVTGRELARRSYVPERR